MNDEFLKQQRRSPRPEFATTLYERINPPMNATSTFRPVMRRMALALAVIIILLAATLVVSPPARTLAQAFLRQIGLMTFTNDVWQEPEPSQGTAPLPNPTSTPIPVPQPQYASDWEKAAAQAGFSPLRPAYIPDGYTLDWVVAMEYIGTASRSEGMGTSVRYVTADGAHYLDVQQTLFTTAQEFPVGDNVMVDVTVRGREGVWLEQAILAPEGTESAYSPANLLLWDEDGFIFAIFSDSLSQAEMISIAESLGQ